LQELEPALDRGEIDVLLLRDAHTTFESPLGQGLSQALRQREDVLVVSFASEHDESSLFADLVLPEPTFVERWDLLTDTPVVSRPHVSLQQPVIDPLFDAQPSEDVLLRWASALAPEHGTRFPDETMDKLVKRAANALAADARGGVFEDLNPAADARSPSSPRAFWKAFRRTGVWAFRPEEAAPQPPSRRVVMLPHGVLGLSEPVSLDSLRELVLPRESGDPLVRPYRLSTFRVPELRDGQLANYQTMMEASGHWSEAIWETWVELNPRTAAQAGVRNGDRVRLVSDRAAIEAVARLTEGIAPGVVAVPLGMGHEVGTTAAGIGANPNSLLETSGLRSGEAEFEGVTRVSLQRI